MGESAGAVVAPSAAIGNKRRRRRSCLSSGDATAPETSGVKAQLLFVGFPRWSIVLLDVVVIVHNSVTSDSQASRAAQATSIIIINV